MKTSPKNRDGFSHRAPHCQSTESPSGQVAVLIADDDPRLLEVVSRDLQESGYRCVTVPDGESALIALHEYDYSVALIDLDMPRVNGFEVLSALQKEELGVVPIILTGMGDIKKTVRMMKLGAYDVVEKPVAPALLKVAVDRAVEHRHLRDSARALELKAKEREAEAAKANEMLRLDEERLEALWKLSQMGERSFEEITHFALEEGVRLTGSSIGYLAFMNEDETILTMHAWSKTAMALCSMIDKPIEYPVEETGLWGEAVRQRRPVITNDYEAPSPFKRGTPEGHVCVSRHMNVPVFDEERIVLVAGVGNKSAPYEDADVRQLELLMDGMWRIVRQKRAIENLKQVNRLLRVLSECNQAIVHCPDEAELLRQTCRILVDFGGYSLAWIGITKGDSSLVPVAQCGFGAATLPLAAVDGLDCEAMAGIVSESLLTGEPRLSTNIGKCPSLAFWHDEALRHGCAQHAAIPFVLSEEMTSGVVGISTMNSDSFVGVEMNLLKELASDLAYAITSLRRRSEYQATQRQIAGLSSLKEQLLGALGLPQKLRLITDAVVGVFGADFARIWTIGEGDLCNAGCVHAQVTEGPLVCRDRAKCLHLVASSGRYTHTDGNHRRVPIGCYKIGRIVSSDESGFVTNDVAHDSRVHDREWAAELGLVSFAGLRLLSPEGSPIGVLALFSKLPIAEGQRNLLEDLGNTASHVILTGLATEALRESERWSQAILQGCPIPQFVIDRHHRVISWNQPMEKCTGISREQVLGTSEHWRTFYTEPRLCLADLLVDGATDLIPKWYGDKVKKAPLLEDAFAGVDFFPRLGTAGMWLHFTAAPIRDANGNIIGAIETFEDITERKRIEDALELRLLALTRPLGDTAPELLLEELFNVEELQEIQDAFSAATGVASIITRPDGTPVTRPSNFCHLCENIIRKTERGLANCYHSDAVLGNRSGDGPVLQPCLSGGLWDGGTSICVGDRHIANWLIGQVLDEAVDEERMLRYAREIGANEQEFAEALSRVTRMPKKQFEDVCTALFLLARQLSNLAFQNIQQAQHITERKRAEDELQRSRDQLEIRVAERTHELTQANASLQCEVQRRTLTEEELRRAHGEVERLLASMPSFLIGLAQDMRISRWNAVAEATFGITREEVVGKNIEESGIHWSWESVATQVPGWPTISETVRLPEVRYTRTDGTEGFLGITISPVRNDDGAYDGCLLLGMDTTEFRNLEAQLVQAQKLEAVGRLAAGIAHEINTPTQYVGDNHCCPK